MPGTSPSPAPIWRTSPSTTRPARALARRRPPCTCEQLPVLGGPERPGSVEEGPGLLLLPELAARRGEVLEHSRQKLLVLAVSTSLLGVIEDLEGPPQVLVRLGELALGSVEAPELAPDLAGMMAARPGEKLEAPLEGCRCIIALALDEESPGALEERAGPPVARSNLT